MNVNTAIQAFSSSHLKIKQVSGFAHEKKNQFVIQKEQAINKLSKYLEDNKSTCVPVKIKDLDKNMYIRLKHNITNKNVNEKSLLNFVNSLDFINLKEISQGSLKNTIENYLYDTLHNEHRKESTSFILTDICERGTKNDFQKQIPEDIHIQANELYSAKIQIATIQTKAKTAKRKYVVEQKRVEPFLLKHLDAMQSQNKQQKVDINYKNKKQSLLLTKKKSHVRKQIPATKFKHVFASALQDIDDKYSLLEAKTILLSQSFKDKLLHILQTTLTELSITATTEHVSLEKIHKT